MPELPEVEVTRLSFAERIAGACVLDVRLGKPLRWPLGVAPAELTGRVVQGVRRRGKYLLLDLDHGMLLLHLGMSGSIQFSPVLPPAGVHDHFELHTTHGLLRLHDPRRFGAVVYVEGEADPVARKLLGGLGVEPLTDDFKPEQLHRGLRRRQASIKQVLLAGDIVVGVGNIYASEALFLAGIRPTVSACKLSLARASRLHAAIRSVLNKALTSGGSTLRNFSNAHGQSGYFQLEVNVYDRAGEPCRVCGTPIKLLRQGQRSTFYCPHCQRP
ncbi:MAG TPA: bifunctional DNA-formamidopyrimidine glycosylase/DNA-(apurinic or apyrimidinic site) lyase [Macromonas sp.]|nr:bifunctional DNA-formamidopyrimidine glycosylase/DNA-(apurinic or apyrimidinic site) lyase [Macromonas sp.]